MTIARLFRIMSPPTEPVESNGSWSSVESALEIKIPDDFKSFIERYGSGTIGDFISVLNPFSLRPNLNLMEQSKRQLIALRDLHDDFGEPSPFELYPTAGGLLPVAITDNGDVIHWMTNGDPVDWTVVVNEARSPDYQQFSCNLTVFLADVIEKSIVCRAFPKSIFDDGVEFHPV